VASLLRRTRHHHIFNQPKMIKVIVIEDERHSRDILENMLQQHFKNIEVIAVCKNSEEGKTAIESLSPDLVLTDIELEKKPVFEMLQQLSSINFEIIFTTAHEQYAIQAIKFSALDYLLKPFSLEDLSAAIKRYEQKNISNNLRDNSMRFFIT